MLTLSITTDTLTNEEAGAAMALLLTLRPDALESALASLGRDQLALPLAATTHTVGPVSVPATPEAAAAAFASSAIVQPAEAGVPTAPLEPAKSATAPETVAHSPIASAGPATAPASGPELDSEGLPWDARIHASPASLTKKGPWRAKRSLNQLVEQNVKAELRAALAAPAAPASVPVPPPPAAPVETPAERTAREAVEQGLIAPPPPPPPPPPAPAPSVPPPPPPTSVASAPAVSTPLQGHAAASPDLSRFAEAMRKTTAAQMATPPQITVEETQAVLAHLGLSQARDLLARPDLIDPFVASVDLHIARFA